MARNTGFALAKGKYTAFPDIDDVIHPQMYSRRMQGSMKRLNNVNYSASVTYALQALGEMFDRPDFKEEARIVASDLKKFFTANDSFLYGEGTKI